MSKKTHLLSFSWMPGSQGTARTCTGSLLTRLPRHRVAEVEVHLPNPWKKQMCTQSSCLPRAASPVADPADVLPKLCPSLGHQPSLCPLPIALLSQRVAFLHRVGTSLLNTVVCGLAEQWEIGFALQSYCTINPEEQCKDLMDQSGATGFHPFRSSPNPAALCPCVLPGASASFPSDCWTSLRQLDLWSLVEQA